MPAGKPHASVVITTRNRKNELRQALDSAMKQSVPVEVIVIDDHSDDGTPEMVAAEFPAVQLVTHPERAGYIVLRNLGMRLASAPYVISIDDDAIFTTPHVVEQTLRAFTDERIAAVAIPYADIRISPTIRQRAPSPAGVYVTDWFIGTAHAIRRSAFQAVGGYREYFIHQCEEVDLCARLMDRGYIVRAGTSDPVHHFVCPKRDMGRLHYFGTRNNVLMMWLSVPTLLLPFHFVVFIEHTIVHAIRTRALGIKLRALFAGIAVAARHFRERSPISIRTYRLIRSLRHQPLPLQEIEAFLPPLASARTVPSGPTLTPASGTWKHGARTAAA